jgi:nucleoside 2-deoxyribosyltransferase
MIKRVYLAGPDVFFKDPQKSAEALKALCAKEGLLGVFPLDAEITFSPNDTPKMKAVKIFRANVNLLDGCHGVLANMMPFRGPSTDVGTAWEMGYGYAKGLPVVGYSPDLRPYATRAVPDEFLAENFNLVDNLMLTCSIEGCLPLEEAIKTLASVLS